MIVRLKDGSEHALPDTTWESLVERLTRDSLTGSAVALDDREVTATDGTVFRFADILAATDG